MGLEQGAAEDDALFSRWSARVAGMSLEKKPKKNIFGEKAELSEGGSI